MDANRITIRRYTKDQKKLYTDIYRDLYKAIKFDGDAFRLKFDIARSLNFPVDFVPIDMHDTLLHYVFSNEMYNRERVDYLISLKVPQQLIKVGADVNKLNEDGENVLIAAVRALACTRTVKSILTRTNNVNFTACLGSKNRTAFGRAALNYKWAPMYNEMAKCVRVMQLLLRAGADPYLDSEWQNSVFSDRVDIIKKLVVDYRLALLKPDTSDGYVYYEYEL